MEIFAAWLLVITVELVTPRFITPASDAWESICVDGFEGEWIPDEKNGNKMCTKGPQHLIMDRLE